MTLKVFNLVGVESSFLHNDQQHHLRSREFQGFEFEVSVFRPKNERWAKRI